jgi:hypothetical protein
LDAAARVLHDELRFIRNAVLSGDKIQLLKTLDERGTAEELVQREYGGRYVFELLQNANDAAGAKGSTDARHRVAIILAEESLLFANEGQAFQAENVQSICTLGRSSKDPRKALGYKGLGFKAVGELTEQPQVISPPYQFGFGNEQARREITKLVGPLPPSQRLPVYAFPFPLHATSLGHDRERIDSLLDDGFVTVIRLPFRPGVEWQDVLGHVRSDINPELLLFLDATTEIVISWPGGKSRMFKGEVEARGKGAVVDIGQDDQPCQRWLVFKSGPIPLRDVRLVESLDRTWHRVRRVSATIAFPLDGPRLALEQPERPVSVYFPTESRTGHSFVLNADFYVDFDRRHISGTPQARPYNMWLAERVAAFFGRTALPELAHLYPEDYRVVHACAPTGSPSGFGNEISGLLREVLERTRFVPASGGPVTPRAALRSPVPRDALAAFHRFFDRQTLGVARRSLVHVDVENDRRADELIRSLGAETVPDDPILRFLRRHPDVSQHELADFYVLLGRWVSHQEPAFRRGQLRDELKRRPLLYTFDGRWVRATETVFFPRARTAPDLPIGFPRNILHADCTAGRQEAQRFLEDLGVEPFRWREVILTSLLPTLRRKPTEGQIEAAHRFLRTYFAEERGGDQDIASQIGIVPVRGRAHRRRSWAWRPAGETYFGRDWLGSPDLEELFGPLGRQEFLAELMPDDQEVRAADRSYFAWLGVADRPRALPFDTNIQSGWTQRRPARADAARWRTYLQSLAEQAEDPEGHPHSQYLRTHVLDRLDELLLEPTPKQGQALLRLLAEHWETYGPTLDAAVHCRNAQHRGERSRPVRSYAGFSLRGRPWVPARIGNTTPMLRPGQVWLTGPDMPRRLGQLLPQVTTERYPPLVQLVADALGFVDPSAASADDYVNLLGLLPSEFPLPAPSSLKSARRRRLYEEQTVELGRWVMRSLNAVLPDPPTVPESRRAEWRQIPLLALENSQLTFAVQPVLADNGRLAKRLGDRFAWFHGDRGLSKLLSAFGLRRLTAIASVDPIVGDPLDQLTRDLTKRLDEAVPYLLAFYEAEAPSEPKQARGRLSRFTISVVEHLTLKVSVRDVVPEERLVEEETYLKQTRPPGIGPIRPAMATYYCTLPP